MEWHRIKQILIVGIGMLAVVFAAWLCFFRTDDTSTDDTLDSVRTEQRRSLELNRESANRIERSEELNTEASSRIERSEELNRQTEERVTAGQGELDRAKRKLEENRRLFEQVREGK